MARLLALDIGTRRTGVAYADEDVGIALPLATIEHASPEQLKDQVRILCDERQIDHLVIGLPLLPSGEEGSQAAVVRAYAETLKELSIPLSFVDERYSTSAGKARLEKKKMIAGAKDDNAAAACQILGKYLGY